MAAASSGPWVLRSPDRSFGVTFSRVSRGVRLMFSHCPPICEPIVLVRPVRVARAEYRRLLQLGYRPQS